MMRPVVRKDFLVRADGEFVRDTRGHLVKFTEKGAHRWAARRQPQSYSVIRMSRPTEPSPCDHGSYWTDKERNRHCLMCSHVVDKEGNEIHEPSDPCSMCGWTGPQTQYLGVDRRPITHPPAPHEKDWLPQLLRAESTVSEEER